jgi:hypothetical protein
MFESNQRRLNLYFGEERKKLDKNCSTFKNVVLELHL